MSTDPQWLIQDGIGKKGATTTNYGYLNTYPPGNTVGSQFSLIGVKDPVIIGKKNQANALFAIFQGGEFYSSRNSNPLLPYFGTGTCLSNSNFPDSHNIQSLCGNVEYLYLTNIYEGNDLPPGVIVNPGSDPRYGANYQIDQILSNNMIGIVQASHSVSPDADITIVISHDKISALNKVNNYYYLEYNKVLDVHTQVTFPNTGFFRLEAFSNAHPAGIITGGGFQTNVNGPDTIAFNILGGHFTYINFKSSPRNHNYYIPAGDRRLQVDPDAHDYEAIFQVYGDQTGLVSNVPLKEPIRVIT